jgi:hypothetical protein|tara:strand:- start:2729 stop:2986 length:258 start_codon:yes stop_codon:yes gene_type:complete
MRLVKFKISDDLFQGFEVVLDLDYFETIDEIYKQVTETIKCHLEMHKFEKLLEKLKEKNFHIHDEEFGSILLKSENDVVWVCSHC